MIDFEIIKTKDTNDWWEHLKEHFDSLVTLKDEDFIHMKDLGGVWDQLYAIGEGWTDD